MQQKSDPIRESGGSTDSATRKRKRTPKRKPAPRKTAMRGFQDAQLNLEWFKASDEIYEYIRELKGEQ